MSAVKSPGTEANDIPDAAITVDDDGNTRTDEDQQKQIRKRFGIMQSFWSSIFAEGLKDDRFVGGEQWTEELRKERQEDRRPILTYNMLPSFNRQITNRIRQERPSVKVTPVETNRGTDPRIKNVTGTKDYSLAEVYAGMIKNIEHVSRADQAYDTATKHAVDHGFGFFYQIPQWSKLDPFVQDLMIHRVKNSYSVMLDPDAQEADYRDMQDAFMFTNINRHTYEAKYPDKPFTQFASAEMGSTYEGWYDGDNLRIAQYFWVDHRDDEALMLTNGKLVYLSDVKDVLDDLEKDTGIHITENDDGTEMRKKVKRPICVWQKMTADHILEGPIDLPFSGVPIYPVFGEEVLIDGKVRYESAIRHAKDAQKSYNYWRTAAAETVALAPRAPWMITDRQLKGHEGMYEMANTANLPYLTYNHVEGVAPPQRNFGTQPAAAELQNATQDGVDMQTIIGLHDASLGKESNEKSGKAIVARQNAGTTSTFQFPDNLGRALEQMGRHIVEAIPRLHDTNRQVRVRMPDGADDFVELNQAVKDEKTGEIHLIHDIAYGKYDVVLETGPSYATQRQEAADLQMELLKVLGPDRAGNIVHLIVQNLGVPGSEEVAAVLRKMLPDNLKTEDEKMADLPAGVQKDPESGQLMGEDGQPWQPEPTMEMQLMQKQQQIDELKHNAELEKHKATGAQAQADLKEAERDLAQLQADADAGGQQDPDAQAQQQEQNLTAIREAIEETMRKHADDPEAHGAMDIEEKIATAIVDALNRVRGYVDRQIKAGGIVDGDTIAAPDGRQSAPNRTPSGGKTDMTFNFDDKPAALSFEYDDAGKLVKAVPEYSKPGKEPDA